jgi:outer membrane autotransporter protein
MNKSLRIHAIAYTMSLLSLCNSHLSADVAGLVGGIQNSELFFGLLSSSGDITALSGFPTALTNISPVALNDSGNGVVGGRGFAGIVSSAAQYTALGVSTTTEISTVAINNSGNAIIGGFNPDTGITGGYAALVSPSGALTSLAGMPATGLINSVAINSSGNGFIGGLSNPSSPPTPYAAFVSSSGTTLPILGLAPTGGVSAVALNDQGVGLIGGYTGPTLSPSGPYGALVAADGTVTTLSGLVNPPLTVALSNSGTGLLTNYGYAALVSPSGTVTQLTLASNPTLISCAINDTGLGIIGGDTGNPMYAAFVSPAGVVTPISGLPNSGTVNSVAINSDGNALVAGATYDALFRPSLYATLVMADGTLIPLNNPQSGDISSAGISIFSLSPSPSPSPFTIDSIPTDNLVGGNFALATYLNYVAPARAFYFVPSVASGTLPQALQSVSPTRHVADLFAASTNSFHVSNVFNQRMEDIRQFRKQRDAESASAISARESQNLFCSLSPTPTAKKSAATLKEERPYHIWTQGVGVTAHQKATSQSFGFRPSTVGFLLGIDRHISHNSTYGVGTAYTHTYVHQEQKSGHSRIDQEYLFIYGIWNYNKFYADAALWGGHCQIHNVRNMHMQSFRFQATSRPKSWQFSPHLELGYEQGYKITKFEPFAMFDWTNNWQEYYEEKGSSPFNFGQKEHYSSILRSELGLRLYETITFPTWRLIFQEKGSWVNLTSAHMNSVTAFLVGSPESFTVRTPASAKNLGSVAGKAFFEPRNPKYPYGVIAYQGELAKSYQSHELSLSLGLSF